MPKVACSQTVPGAKWAFSKPWASISSNSSLWSEESVPESITSHLPDRMRAMLATVSSSTKRTPIPGDGAILTGAAQGEHHLSNRKADELAGSIQHPVPFLHSNTLNPGIPIRQAGELLEDDRLIIEAARVDWTVVNSFQDLALRVHQTGEQEERVRLGSRANGQGLEI